METNNEKTFKCLNCGKETTSKRNNLFCSNDCYLEFRKRPNQIIKKELYAELIIRSMRYGTKHIVIDLEDAEKCRNYKWFLSFDEVLNSFYVKTSKYPYSLHRVIMDCPKGFVVDHINHNTLDNRKENLRICTHAENMQNRKRVRECVNCIDLKRQNEELQKENEELKTANLHIENNRKHKANKLNRIEKLILTCTTGYTDEFIQELLIILHEPEPVSFENKYLQTLTEIKEITEDAKTKVFVDMEEFWKQILQKISEVENASK